VQAGRKKAKGKSKKAKVKRPLLVKISGDSLSYLLPFNFLLLPS
jgi:hypothetical protein